MNGSIRKRGKSSWELTIDLGRDADGKRVRKFVTVCCKTKGEADRKLRELLTSHDKGIPMDDSKLTVAQYLDRWLTDYVVPNTRPRTAEGYEGVIRRYIVPAVGNVHLTKLQAAEIQQMEARLLEKGLAPRTVQQAHRALSEALKHAVKWGLTWRNPAQAVDAPKVTYREPAIPSAEGVHRFFALAQENPLHAIFYFLAFTGCRRSEALGVRWQDVDFDNGMVSIVQTSQRIAHRGIISQPTKSAKGRRAIALDPDTVALLRAHRVKQLENRLRLGEAYQDQGSVFCNIDGSPLNPDLSTRTFRRLADQIGLKGVRLHDLRHFHASTLLQAGIHPKVVQERLGHATIATTMDIYSHVLPGLQEQAALAFSASMKAAKKSV